ncbi:MAG TPA: hypothetical protein VGE31_01835 [Candidatus Paceibacterota bacterium]
MDPVTATATTSTPRVETVGIDPFTPLVYFFENGVDGPLGWVIAFLNGLWTLYVFLAFALSIVMLWLYAYASTKRWEYYIKSDKELRDDEALYDELYRGVKKNSRLNDVFVHIDSDNPNDWKLAIIEADIILDEALKERGYGGSSLGERLRNVSPTQLNSLNDAWEAHKIRNRIAHDGADFVLTHRLAEETINRYRRVFSELGVQ